MNDYEYLKNYKPERNSIGRKIRDLMGDTMDMVFGVFFDDDDRDQKESDTDSAESIDITDMSELETEEEPEKRQKEQGLKILTPKQMITRLPILLAELKAGNNSQK